MERELADGRTQAHFARRTELNDALRVCYAARLGSDPARRRADDLPTDGMARAAGARLRPGDEILTSDEEHPGLLGALGAPGSCTASSCAKSRSTIHERRWPEHAPRRVLARELDRGKLAPVELGQLDVPVLLDGAQGLGAVPTDVLALGCAAYAAAGQKWLCGPDGTGMLFSQRPVARAARLTRRGYPNLADPGAGLDARLHEDARRFDAPSLSAEAVACALAGVAVFEQAGWDAVHKRARTLAATLAERLSSRDASRLRVVRARSCRSPAPTPRPSATRSPPQASSCATSPGGPRCGRPSARGPTRAISIGCSARCTDDRVATSRARRGRAQLNLALERMRRELHKWNLAQMTSISSPVE